MKMDNDPKRSFIDTFRKQKIRNVRMPNPLEINGGGCFGKR
jgi:hypothetical protein